MSSYFAKIGLIIFPSLHPETKSAVELLESTTTDTFPPYVSNAEDNVSELLSNDRSHSVLRRCLYALDFSRVTAWREGCRGSQRKSSRGRREARIEEDQNGFRFGPREDCEQSIRFWFSAWKTWFTGLRPTPGLDLYRIIVTFFTRQSAVDNATSVETMDWRNWVCSRYRKCSPIPNIWTTNTRRGLIRILLNTRLEVFEQVANTYVPRKFCNKVIVMHFKKKIEVPTFC